MQKLRSDTRIDRIQARLVIHDAIEHRLQEIDTEALRFLAAAEAPDAEATFARQRP